MHESLRQEKAKSCDSLVTAEDKTDFKCFETNPHKYSSKMMNSIWGLYNRYAPEAFQKNQEVTMAAPLTTPLSSIQFA
ncbi:hypothetical protein HDE_08642 [Halotydeus destructor]|nr:hypothetical protein HDE_08642 [Halotydeus destructor]